MIIRVHKLEDGRILIAAIDTALQGKKYEEGTAQLDFTTEFYQGTERAPQEAGDLFRNADLLNLAGEETIKIAIEEGVLQQQDVKTLRGIPYAQAVLLQE